MNGSDTVLAMLSGLGLFCVAVALAVGCWHGWMKQWCRRNLRNRP